MLTLSVFNKTKDLSPVSILGETFVCHIHRIINYQFTVRFFFKDYRMKSYHWCSNFTFASYQLYDWISYIISKPQFLYLYDRDNSNGTSWHCLRIKWNVRKDLLVSVSCFVPMLFITLLSNIFILYIRLR